MNIDDVLAAADRPERTVPICLKGKLVAEHEAAERELLAAQRTAATKMADSARAAKQAKKVQELEEQMTAGSVTFRVRGLSYFEKEAWQKAHPAREGEQERFNPVTAGPDLVARCLIDPAATVEQAQQLLERIGSGQADKLMGACLSATDEDGDVPFSLAASVTLRSSGRRQ